MCQEARIIILVVVCVREVGIIVHRIFRDICIRAYRLPRRLVITFSGELFSSSLPAA